MSRRSRERWERDRLATGLYAAGAARAWLGRPLARLLWGADVRRFYGERRGHVDLAERSVVLDVPCGAGALFGWPPPSDEPGPRYLAVDRSPLMLARARRVARVRRLDRVHLVRADALELPLADATVDLVLAHNSLHCYGEPARAVQEMTRVLAPGGAVRGSVIIAGAGRRSDLVIRAALRLGMFRSRVRSADLATWLRAAGLCDVTIEPSGAFTLFSARRPE